MADRLAELVVGLQRLAENARLRGDDLRYTQEREDVEHRDYLNQLLAITQRLHSTLIDEVRRFPVASDLVPPAQLNPATQGQAALGKNLADQRSAIAAAGQTDEKPMPKFLQQGPRKEGQ